MPPRLKPAWCALTASALLAVTGCGETALLSVDQGSGPKPALPEPRPTLIPTVQIAPARPWPPGTAPQPAAGLQVAAFARFLDHPRWLFQLPNGDVLVAESNTPAKDGGWLGLKAWVAGLLMQRAGAGVPSADRITLLRDVDGDGVAETRSVLLAGLHSPFGVALVGNELYVAHADAVLAFPYRSGDTRISAPGRVLLQLPGGPINHHWTKNLLASRDGTQLYVSIGSNSNAAEGGMAIEEGRAAIWEVDIASGAHRVFASGLRNPVGMAWGPDGALWTAVNERDELGSDLVPDYITRVQDGGFYGWPWSYYGNHVDSRVQPPNPAMVARALVPDYALGPHTASLGLASAERSRLPAPFVGGLFVGQHGSWNRQPPSGYKVVFVPFVSGQPAGLPIDVLGGFLDPEGQARGRPVGVLVDQAGALLVADDVGNVIWRVTQAR